MSRIDFTINQEQRRLDVDPEMPLLWAIRDHLGLTGTKYSCGISLCGACTVHIDGQAVKSCVTDMGAVRGRSITTIEGLAQNGILHKVQQAWLDEEVAQCGYCQPGQIMTAAALLAANPRPSNSDIDKAMDGVLCRCGTYQRIRKAIHRAAAAV
ncbi:MAG: (2Fe-2S)-binding protein [Candidatus Marinimicrobia bacterium]|nr:(2Fe-2S)-binding protein [Candidatus Neomarinimicrobiota bacterium]